ncbi:unnamed protein product, partial [Durusdinium trenchii]
FGSAAADCRSSQRHSFLVLRQVAAAGSFTRGVGAALFMRICWLLLAQAAAACTQTGQFDEAAFTASLYAGSFGGVLLGLLLCILASLPLCCGVLKEHSKVISTITISLGILTLVVPLLGSLSACGPFVQTVCSDRCSGYECTSQEEEELSQVCHALGFIVVYIGAFGWAACVVGIVAASLGCCVCCQCCRPMHQPVSPQVVPERPEVENDLDPKFSGPAVPVMVVGTPSPKQAM